MKKAKAKTCIEVKPTFYKADLIRSKRFLAYRDVLSVVLKDDKAYTMEQVEKLIQMFLNGNEVK